MKKSWMITAIIAALLGASCSTTYQTYRSDLFEGKKLLRQEEYVKARDLFVKASGEEKRAAPFALAATASYKLNDLSAAETYVNQAEKAEGRAYYYLRIAGYKTLILLKEGKKKEGMDALRSYIEYYSYQYPLMNIEQVKAMYRKGEIDLPALENIVDEQITTYENEIEQAVTTGTGFYSTVPPPRPVGTNLMPD